MGVNQALDAKDISSISYEDDCNVSFLNNKIPCRFCALKDLCMSAEVDLSIPKHLTRIVEHPRPIHRGEHLFRQGDVLRNLYIVRTGGVKLYLTTQDGTEQILNFYFPGELLSLDSIENHQHNTSAVALDTTSVCKFPFNHVIELCHHLPDLYDLLLKIAGKHIANKQNMMMLLGQKPAEERFAAFLLDIALRNKSNGHAHNNFILCMSRHDIANYLCLADETISRLFSKFASEGILETKNRLVRIHDFGRLQYITEMWYPELKLASGNSKA